MQQWTYCIEHKRFPSFEDCPSPEEQELAWLNEMGAQGWELVSVMPKPNWADDDWLTYRFKRAATSHPYR